MDLHQCHTTMWQHPNNVYNNLSNEAFWSTLPSTYKVWKFLSLYVYMFVCFVALRSHKLWGIWGQAWYYWKSLWEGGGCNGLVSWCLDTMWHNLWIWSDLWHGKIISMNIMSILWQRQQIWVHWGLGIIFYRQQIWYMLFLQSIFMSMTCGSQ